MRNTWFDLGLVLGLAGLLADASVSAQDTLRISEFLAVNNGPLVDEDGEESDWIEIHNYGTNAASLAGWYLTDRANDLTQWQFPATNVPPNGYLLVFASGKNRRRAGEPLHTNFRLSNTGEYLALVKPDGVTVASAYTPTFPGQVAGISYGIPLQQVVTTLLPTGAAARVFVPLNDSLSNSWTAIDFDDSGWMPARTGVGYETDGQAPFVSMTIADSVAEFSGVQGSNNWFYGYWDKGADADGVYRDSEFAAFPNGDGPHSELNYWNGASWDWFDGNPPWTELTATGGHPSANNSGAAPADHWAVRRYVAEASGPFRITGRLEHRSDWVYVTATGVAANSTLYVYFAAAGEGYIDDMKLVAGSVAEQGPNLLPNGDFESASLTPWTVSANHVRSHTTNSVAHSGARSLHIIATSGGTTQTSSIWQNISPALVNGQTYTLSYWYLPGTNPAPLVVRFSGNWINTTPQYCGDGVVGRIFVDGAQVFERTAFVSGSDYSLTVPGQLGSRIDFVLDAGAANNDFCDGSTFTAKIDTADPTIAVVADSVADWSLTGTQGEKNWFYGYANKSTFTTYRVTNFVAFPHDNGPPSVNNFWTGTAWDWFNGNPPWDEIGQTFVHPNGVNNGAEHWVIRRWVSEVAGRITVEWTLAKQNPAGTGVTGAIYHNAQLRDSAIVAGTDAVGVSRTATITNVQVGDFIDVVLTPVGTGNATGDESDGSVMTAVIKGAPSLTSQIVTNIETAMKGGNATAYLRIPFVVNDPSAISFLTLRMKHDDGFIAYLNGAGVATRNAPVVFPEYPTWNSSATVTRSDADAIQFEDFDLTAEVGLLRPGTNVLAIHGLNASASDGDFLILPELRGISLVSDTASPRYFTAPTPGSVNGLGNTNLGPIIKNLAHTPGVPLDLENLYVTAQVIPTFNPIRAVTLTYRVMFSNEVTVPMFDDGTHSDGAAGDGLYGAVIPASASNPGQMVRYFVFATDTAPQTNRTRFPPFTSPVNSPQYFGTVVHNPGLTSSLPVLHWFIQNPGAADSDTSARCSIFFDGEFYDNVGANLHGQSARGFPKHSYDFDMNPGFNFRWSSDPDEVRVDDFNLLSTFADKSHMRNMLSYGAHRDAGGPYHFAFAVRVQQNGAFYSVANLVENGDENYLKRLGLDANGALYKMYNTFSSSADATIGINGNFAEKKTRKNEGNADLLALFNGISQAGQALINYVFDNIDVPEVVNFLACHVVTADEDCCHKNYYFYRDTEGTGEWQMTPWDVDLSFGHTWSNPSSGGFAYYDPRIFASNFYSGNSLNIGANNRLPAALLSIPWVNQMYLRRVRTVTDEQLQPPTTHPLLLNYERQIDEMASAISPDAALDFVKWIIPNRTAYPPTQSLAQAVADLKFAYLALRRPWIYGTLSYTNNGPYMAPQPSNAVVRFGDIEFNPASGNQAQEYIQLRNPNSYPVDISGWQITGAVEYTFRGGVVLPTNGVLYVSPDVRAFRTRTTGPRGGQGLFVQGGYKGQLSARGEMLHLVDKTGRIVQQTNYPSTASLPQQYLRVTEIMYHPSVLPAGVSTNAEDYEYIELKNIGPVTLDLTGVRFANGIEFSFTGSSVTSLPPGERVLVVRNLAAFTSRYGGGLKVAGQYTGALENGGENLLLLDATNEKVLDFAYNNAWYEITDGFGFSLVIVDENALWNTWDLKESWRPSGTLSGTPGQSNTVLSGIAGILMNEVLTRTDLPQIDAVELFNPTTNDVNIGGWFLTDDFNTPKKYRIPNNTIISAGGYRVFTENEFNPGGNGFAFSSLGDEAYVFSGDANTNLTGYFHGFDFGAADNGVSFGRHVTSLGEEHFVAQSANTFTNANAAPRVGPIVISEIMFRPPDLSGGADNQDDEFVELRNIASTNVMLHPAASTNAWRLRGGVGFDFPSGAMLGAGSNLLVVSFNTTNAAKVAAFRSKYGVPASVQLFGPYAGKLDNSADRVRLDKPGVPEPGGEVPFVIIDAIDYQDSAPWPEGADGTGASLQRTSLTQYGNDPVNWIAGTPTTGAEFGGGTPPLITVQPSDQTAVAFGPATFMVGAGGSEPLRYQWRVNGTNIAYGTNATLVVPNVSPYGAASYSVVVFNLAGTATSSNAALSVLIPAAILTQPQGRTVFPFTNVTFSVVAASTSPLRYQWRFNSMDIANATNVSYTVNNVQASHEGDYTVVVTDAVGPVASAPARLTVLLHPLFTVHPTNRTVTLPGPVNVTNRSLAISSTPLRYQWLFNGTNLPGATNASLVISNVEAAHAGTYASVATDNFGSITSAVAALTVLYRPGFSIQPLSQTALLGGNAIFTVGATGSIPIGFRWRRGGVTFTNAMIFGTPTSSAMILTNVKVSDATNYTVVASNLAGTSPVSSNVFLTVLLDSDGDGIPDALEPVDGAADTDGDGMTNAEEYLAGTDALDPESYLRLEIAADGGAILWFNALSNRTYTVEFTDGLSPSAWQKFGDVLAQPLSRTELLVDPSPGPNRFYRLTTPLHR